MVKNKRFEWLASQVQVGIPSGERITELEVRIEDLEAEVITLKKQMKEVKNG